MHSKTYSYSYNSDTIPYTVWFSEDSKIIETIVFLGTVQIDSLPQWVVESCPPRTAVVQGAPHWFAKSDGSDIPTYMFNYTKEAFNGILADSKFKNLNIIADSQAVPGVVRLFSQTSYTHLIGYVVLLQPLGFNHSSFTGSDKQRLAIFRKRIIENARYQLIDLIKDRRLRYNHKLLSKMVKFGDPKARSQYSSGLAHDALPDLRRLVNYNKRVMILCGDKDKIFPPREIQDNLAKALVDVQVIIVKGIPHSPLATQKGLTLLRKAFKVLYS